MPTPRVDKMVIRFGTAKPKKSPPKIGDRKTIKGVEHVRQQVLTKDGYHVKNGRPVCEWVPFAQSRQYGTGAK